MLIERFKRGNVFRFTATPLDVDGEIVTPDSVTLYLSYMGASGRVSEQIEMEMETDGDWSAEWDSSVAYKGRVHVAVRAENPSSVSEDRFDLEANLANPDPETA